MTTIAAELGLAKASSIAFFYNPICRHARGRTDGILIPRPTPEKISELPAPASAQMSSIKKRGLKRLRELRFIVK